MNIIVCIKQVPDTTEIKIDQEKHTLIRDGVPSILNPFDGYALEAAARMKDQNPEITIYVLSMGPIQAENALRECLAIAADKAYLLTDQRFGGSDTFATSYILAQAIKHIEETEQIKFQGILCGKQAIDGDTAQVGPELAEHMGYPQVTCCLEVSEEEKGFRVLREGDDNMQRVGVVFPCVLTFTKPEYDPRFPTIKRKIEARKKQIIHIAVEDIPNLDESCIGMKGSPTKVKKSYVQINRKEKNIIVDKSVEETVQEIYKILKTIQICQGEDDDKQK